MNYDSLKQHIADQMGRVDLADQIPLFIEMTEASMNRRLRVASMVCPATSEVSGRYINLPVDYLGLRSIRIKDGNQLVQVSPEIMQNKRVANCSGSPLWFVELGNRIEIYPEAANTTFEIVFYTKIPPLTSDHPSNWVLDSHPDAYVTGALTQYALLYVRNNEQMPDWSGMHEKIMYEIEHADKIDRWSGNSMAVHIA